MTIRFWRRVRIAPGLRVNLSKRGASVSVGRRGAWLTTGPRGQRATIGLPGSGLFITEMISAPQRGRVSQSIGGSRHVYRGGMASRAVYALAGVLGSLPVPARVVIVVALVILGAFGLLVGVGGITAALRIG
jgi:Protein of unknown function (DUF4236)